ncbi:MAG: carboxypeptidase Taq [Chloroflexus sp.]|uniref:carboxypeptidase M32 n=1 Tax=Chloroflexus sp. TaxID=1904827 RepID=UPI0021DC20B7|nr:carboxypeptidase M32 [Chloroflexus sp.]GIV90598.1 MAG: carboxypeptidase Taq [Chloroflexus sp.]
MESRLQELRARLLEIDDINSAAAVLGWDQSTYMPPGGAAARARQLATLSRLAHVRSTDPALGALLAELMPYAEQLPYDHPDAALIRVAHRNYERMTRIPVELASEIASHTAASYQAWTQARPANDFATMLPYLERTLELSRRVADCFPGYDHPADPLIDFSDYGMRASEIRDLFARLRAGLTPIIRAIVAQPPIDDSCLRKYYPRNDQLAFGEQIIRRFGYDFERGRQDLTHHPFATKFSIGDVRITTRINEHDLGDGLFSTLHESGHAMYEQGIDPAFEGTPLCNGVSAGVHESQSRLWENLIGRSRPFWEYFYPELQQTFPQQLGNVSLDEFYRAINRVQPSLIRTDADEVTYNLHVMIRFDLELALLEGSLKLTDLPEAWNARYAEDLGVVVPDYRDGVLQDVHWFGGLIGGAFQGYTIGNILSAQFLAAARSAHPEIDAEIGQGEFATLHGWLREHIYRHGSVFTPAELIERATGRSMQIEPYLQYLRLKYSAIYGIEL